MYYIGIDLGTSACKLLLMDEEGRLHNTVSRDYPIEYPRPGWSQQNPADWLRAVEDGIPALLEGFDAGQVRGIGAGGQMHGLVVLDEHDAVIRPALLWNDGRTAAETEWLNTAIGKDELTRRTANIAYAGFTAPKLLWMRKHEPELFARIRKIMLPKDYINYRLTGVHATDVSDASGTLLFDVQHKCWSRPMLEAVGADEAWMPTLYESMQPISAGGPLLRRLGLPDSVIVAAGAADNAAAAIGTGTVGPGACNISIGTSGTIFISSDAFVPDPANSLHSFAHADGAYYVMGCMLSAASCLKWVMESVFMTADYDAALAGIAPEALGRNPVFFLPYLMGERSPLNDTDARGVFIGMTPDTDRARLLQAVLEGVAFGIRDSLEAARRLGLDICQSRICGGGARSALWRRIFANVCNITLHTPESEQGPGIGAAMLAMVAAGAYPDVRTVCARLARTAGTTAPDPQTAALYEQRYAQFSQIYPALKGVFPQLHV